MPKARHYPKSIGLLTGKGVRVTWRLPALDGRSYLPCFPKDVAESPSLGSVWAGNSRPTPSRKIFGVVASLCGLWSVRMPIIVVCPSCNSKLKAPENLIGKLVKCPTCGQAVPVKAAAPAPAPAPKPPMRPAPPPQQPFAEMEPVEDELETPGGRQGGYDELGGQTAAPGGETTEKERSTAMWIHLLPVVTSVCCGPFVIIGILGSIVMWSSKRKESPFIDHHGKTWLNFFINVFVLNFVLSIFFGIGAILNGVLSDASWVGLILEIPFGLMMAALGIYATIMYIVAALKAKKGEWFQYRTLFKLLK
jgi:uncharacterized protein